MKESSSLRFFIKNCLKSVLLLNISCLVSDSSKTVRLVAFYFYAVLVDSGFALLNYPLRNFELVI